MFVEKAYEKIGWKNIWILKWFFVISMIKTWPGIFGLYSYQFTSSLPLEYHCKFSNSTLSQAIPAENINGQLVYKKCVEYVNPGKSNKTQKCSNGITYKMGSMKTSAIKDFNLVCEREFLRNIKDATLLCFVCLGSVFNAIFSDKYGRRILLLITFTGCNIVAIFLTFATNIIYLIMFQIFAGIFQEASYATGFTLLIEFFATKHRTNACLVNSFMWTSGGLVLTFLAFIYRNIHYKYIYLTAAVMMQVPFMFVYCYLPESLRWLYANSKISIVRTKLVSIGQYSKPPITKEILDDLYDEYNDVQEKVVPIYGFCTMFKYWILFKYLLLNALIWCTTGMTYYGIQVMVVENSHNIFVNFTLTFLFDVPANLFVYLLSDHLGRKKIEIGCLFGVWISLACSYVCLIFLRPDNKWPPNIFLLIGKFANAGLYSVIFMHTGEIFPTSLRSTAIGFSSAASRIGAALGVTFTMMSGRTKSLLFIGAITGNVLSIISVILLPETLNKQLPRSIIDSQELSNY